MVFLHFFRTIWHISKIISFKTKKAVSLSKNDFCILLSKDVIYRVSRFDLICGALPQIPNSFFAWHKKGIKKGQGYVRFARKTSAWRLKSFKLACGSNRKDFLTSSSLVFRLTEQGRFGNCDFGQSLYVK